MSLKRNGGTVVVMVEHVAAHRLRDPRLQPRDTRAHHRKLCARRRQLRRALVAYLNVRRSRLPVGAQLLVRLGPVPAQLVGRVLDPGRRVRPCGRTLGVRRPWRQLRLRQALEKARLVGERRIV